MFTNDSGKKERTTIKIDFIAKKNRTTEYYQVALTTLDKNILDRELKPLEGVRDNYPKFLLTLDPGEGESGGIRRINALDWLLQ